MRLTLEIAVATPDEAIAAVRAGADRLELSAGLELGGLTPSLGVFERVRELVGVPVYVLLRPKPGGFRYSASECEAAMRDAGIILRAGADGLVFGALNDRGAIAEEPCRRLVELAGGRVVFHRAFDFLADQRNGLEQLIALGFERVLTSGGKRTAREGAATIAELVAVAAGRIEVMAGGGIRPENVTELVRATRCHQVHAAVRSSVVNECLLSNRELLEAMGADSLGRTVATDAGLVAGLRAALDQSPASLP